jgi:hypothetical protein
MVGIFFLLHVAAKEKKYRMPMDFFILSLPIAACMPGQSCVSGG